MKLLRKIAFSNNRNNKTRSILVIISIVLTTVLLTSIGTFVNGVLKHNVESADKMYGSYYGIFKMITEEQVKEMELDNSYTDIGKTAYAGVTDTDNSIMFVWYDKTARNLINADDSLKEGNFPIKENEIVGSREAFKSLGYADVKIGDTVKANSRFNNDRKFEENEFVISGILKDEKIETKNKSYAMSVSKEFYEKEAQGEFFYSAYFRLNENIDITGDNREEVIKDLGKDIGLGENQVSVNNYYLRFILEPETELFIGAIVISILVIVFSVIVIYNIFQIGILQKVQEYGKLKALGATKKQVKKIVVNEGMSLGLIGVPIGLLLGSLIGGQTTQFLIKISNETFKNITMEKMNLISIPILLLVTIVSLITVRISLIKPVKIVSKIYPIEAIRYQGNTGLTKKSRKGKKTIKLKDLVIANFSINKSRTFKTILTMGLSCVLFVVVVNIAGNFDTHYQSRRNVRYGEFYIELSYSYDDTAYPENNLDNVLKNNPLNNETVGKIKNINGVKDVKTRSIAIVLGDKINNEGSRYGDISIINREDFDFLKDSDGEKFIGVKNYEELVKNNGVFYSSSTFLNEDGYKLNENINFLLNDGISDKKFNTNIMGAFFSSIPTNWAMTEETFNELGLEKNIGFIWVDCNKKDVEEVEKELNDIIGNNEHIEMISYNDSYRENDVSMSMVKLLSYIFLIILGLIGFMNMANTIIISIITRKQEFGILQAIGMTNKQLNHMLQIEGLIFTVGTIIISLIIGMPIGKFAFDYFKNEMGMIGLNNYSLPIKEIVIMILAIALLQGVLSFILSRNIKKDSLVDRIRFQE